MLTNWFQASTTPSLGTWTGPVHVSAGTTLCGSAGRVYGFINNMRYAEESNIGTISTQLFRDIRVPANPQTVRLLGVISQGGNYVVLGWETVPGVPPTLQMPQFTHKMKVDGATVYDFTNAPAAGTNAPTISKYIATPFSWNTGETHTIEFI